MTHSNNGKPRSATLEDFSAARHRTAEVFGLAPDGEPLTLHYLALSAKKVVEYLEREASEEVSQAQKYQLALQDLAENLITEDGKPFATQDQLLTWPADTINDVMQIVAGVKAKEGSEGNVSGEADGSASPTA